MFSVLCITSFVPAVSGLAEWTPNATDTARVTFDGVVKAAGKGRWDAYLKPPFKSSHASMVEQTADGRLHMGWFSGTKEGESGVAIVYSYLDSSKVKEGSIWSSAKVISQRPGYSNQNAVLYAQDEGSVLHVFHSQQKAGAGESAATVWHLSSPIKADGTVKGFGEAKEVFSKPGSFCKNRVVELLDESYMVPIYGQDKKPNYPKNELLAAHQNWNNAKQYTIQSYNSNCDNLVQPTVVRPRKGQEKLVAFFRDRLSRNIYRAMSRTDGKTWTPCEPTSLPNNNAGIHAWPMRSGRIVLVYNPTTHWRSKLAISLSEDQGVTWKYTRILEHSAEDHDEFSYPTLREDRVEKGVIHVSYTYLRQTIKYSRITEDWIMSKDEEIIV